MEDALRVAERCGDVYGPCVVEWKLLECGCGVSSLDGWWGEWCWSVGVGGGGWCYFGPPIFFA